MLEILSSGFACLIFTLHLLPLSARQSLHKTEDTQLPHDPNDEENHDHHYEGGIPILPGPMEREEEARAREKKEEREYKQSHTSLQRKILLTQVGLVVFGMPGTGIGLWQAYVAQESADTAQEAVLLQQKEQREGRLIAEKQLVAGMEQFRNTLAQMKKQTIAQARSATAAENAIEYSERAYVTTDVPQFGTADKEVMIPIVNHGRIPSGTGIVILHEATIPANGPHDSSPKVLLEAHWHHQPVDSIIPNSRVSA